jgi:hypothetical protein
MKVSIFDLHFCDITDIKLQYKMIVGKAKTCNNMANYNMSFSASLPPFYHKTSLL